MYPCRRLPSRRTSLSLVLLIIGLVGWLRPVSQMAGAPPHAGRSPPGINARSHNYSLAALAAMADKGRSTVGLAERRYGRVLASGVLVAPDLVLTARHATHRASAGRARRAPEELEVVLGHGRKDVPSRRFSVAAYAYTSERLDCCLLRIQPNEAGQLPEQDRVQTLSRERVALDAPVVVVHHPQGGGLRFADDARVLVPFEATSAEIASLARIHELGWFEDETRAAWHYVQVKGNALLRNFSPRWAGQPTLCIDAETFDGSSGAPVYAKRTNALIGILYAGSDRSLAQEQSVWRHHEAVLPATAILDDLPPRLRRLLTSREEGGIGMSASRYGHRAASDSEGAPSQVRRRTSAR